MAARDLSRAESFASSHDILSAYGDYLKLASDPSVDVVYIGVIAPKHLQVTVLMLQGSWKFKGEDPFIERWTSGYLTNRVRLNPTKSGVYNYN